MADTKKAPTEAPPSYDAATTSSQSHHASSGPSSSSRGPASTEDGNDPRSLPQGWVKQYDPARKHYFYVDTTTQPPRPIWHHPYDDDDYVATLSPSERANPAIRPKHAAQSSAGGNDHLKSSDGNNQASAPSSSSNSKTKLFGQKMKDKFTHSTHDERQQKRDQKTEEDQRFIEERNRVVTALKQAEQTGEPQYVGKDEEGHDIWAEPLMGPASGYNPYQTGIYKDPNARFIKPQVDTKAPPLPGGYSRYGGYGGGFSYPLAGSPFLVGALYGGFLYGPY